MERGGHVRATGETKMNEVSSRSHAVFIVIAEQSETVYVDDKGSELTAEEFQKFMHTRGVRREQDINRLEDHVRQSFKVSFLTRMLSPTPNLTLILTFMLNPYLSL